MTIFPVVKDAPAVPIAPAALENLNKTKNNTPTETRDQLWRFSVQNILLRHMQNNKMISQCSY